MRGLGSDLAPILTPDMWLIDGSPDTSGKSHSDERGEILDALELKESVRVTFDWTQTQRLRQTADASGRAFGSFC